MNGKPSSLGLMAAMACLAACNGCGPTRPATATVKGNVTYHGKPVVEGTVTFYPEHGRPATGSLAADGSYRLTTFAEGDGAMLGRHRVTIEARRITVSTVPGGTDGESVGAYGPPKVEWLVPEKYSSRNATPLTAEVQAGGNIINFDLPATP